MLSTWRQAARALTLRPAFSLLVISILALCIGGGAAVFSAAKAILLRPLPYQDAERLVVLNLVNLPDRADNSLSYVEAADWRRRSRSLQDLSPYLDWWDRVLIAGDSVETIGVNYVSPSYFKLLGVQPAIGRGFTARDGGAPGSAPFVILSDGLWARRFARDPGIVGRTLRMNSSTYTVIGVMPRGFYDFMQRRHPIDAWLPAVQAGDFSRRGALLFSGRGDRYWDVLARLAPGVGARQAQREVDAIAGRLRGELPDTNRDFGARLIPLRTWVLPDLQQGMKVLLAGAVFVLLLGCANVANLLLARQAERRSDLSLRLALGASHLRLARHAVAEGLLLALPGGALGVLLALAGTRLLAGLLPLPPFVEVRVDGGVLAVTLGASLLTGLLCGLPPALSASRLQAGATLRHLKEGGRGASFRGRGGLVIFQVAVVVVLMVTAGLLLRSYLLLRSTGVDFVSERLLTMRLAFATPSYLDGPPIARAEREILRRVGEIPGVAGAAFWGPGVPGIESQYYDFKPAGAAPGDPSIRSDAHIISPGALALLGVPLLRGRDLGVRDVQGAPRVVVVTRSLAQALWPGREPLGQRLLRTDRPGERPWTVVGVIADTRFQGRFAAQGRHALFPLAQAPMPGAILLLRSELDPARLAAALRREIRQVDPQIPLYDLAPLAQRLRRQEEGRRLNAVVVGLASCLALLLTVLGLYGVLAHAVVQRTREIGLRIALGAGRGDVVAMMMRRGLLLVGAGLLAGLAGALALTRLAARLLFGITPTDPATLAGVTGLFLAVALLATYLPARRAANVEPTIALRGE